MRTASELPHCATPVKLRVRVGRFICSNPDCSRGTFSPPVEQLPPFARQTLRLTEVVEAIGFAAGSRAGTRLAAQIHIPTSRTTILRRLHRAVIKERPTPRVLSVDDFAFRKGHRYGTLLLDLETHSPVDLLPERTAESLAEWLREHPGVEIISRDRGGPYSEGARRGAPEAQQVADRWHLLKNLTDTVERFFIHHHEATQEAQRDVSTTDPGTKSDDEPVAAARVESPVKTRTPNRAEQESQSRRERRLQRYEEVLQLHEQGLSQRVIAKHLNLSRVTVSSYIKGGSFREPSRRQSRCPLLE